MKTTENHFKLFKAECNKWIEFFGLKDWGVSYVWGDVEEARAEIAYHCMDRLAVITLGKEWDELGGITIDSEIIRKVAFHEVCELFLGKLTVTTDQLGRILMESEIIEETHRIIRTMENTVFVHLSHEQ